MGRYLTRPIMIIKLIHPSFLLTVKTVIILVDFHQHTLPPKYICSEILDRKIRFPQSLLTVNVRMGQAGPSSCALLLLLQVREQNMSTISFSIIRELRVGMLVE